MAKDSWSKEKNKDSVSNNKGKKGKGKGKNSVNEVTTSTESATTPRVGTSANQILRTTQGDTWDRPDPMDKDEDEDHERDFAWIAIESRNLHLASASGHKLK